MRALKARYTKRLFYLFLDETVVEAMKSIANKNKGLTPEIVLQEMINLINYIISITSDASIYRYYSNSTQQELFYIARNIGYFQRLQTVDENELFALYIVLLQELEMLNIVTENVGSITIYDCELEKEPFELVIETYEPRV